MTTHPLTIYLNDCRSRRGTGATTPETSLYPPLETLLNAVGHGLKPRVHCFMSLKNQGAGMPDGGLFTPEQIARGVDQPPPGQQPTRGVIECKKPKDDVLALADTKQVSDYWSKYNQVLVTNYWEFLLLGRDEHGHPVGTSTIDLPTPRRSSGSGPPIQPRPPPRTATVCSTSSRAACAARPR